MEFVLLGVGQDGMEIHVKRNAARVAYMVNVTSRMVTASAVNLGKLVSCVKVGKQVCDMAHMICRRYMSPVLLHSYAAIWSTKISNRIFFFLFHSFSIYL